MVPFLKSFGQKMGILRMHILFTRVWGHKSQSILGTFSWQRGCVIFGKTVLCNGDSLIINLSD